MLLHCLLFFGVMGKKIVDRGSVIVEVVEDGLTASSTLMPWSYKSCHWDAFLELSFGILHLLTLARNNLWFGLDEFLPALINKMKNISYILLYYYDTNVHFCKNAILLLDYIGHS